MIFPSRIKRMGLLMPALLFVIPLFADEISEQQARQIAAQFMAESGQQKAVAAVRSDYVQAVPVLAYSRKAEKGERVPLYVYNSSVKDGGFVIVSGDDGTTAPVLGYSDKGSFSYDKAPCGLKMLLSQYEKQIDYLAKHPKLSTKKWSKTRGYADDYDGNIVVAPLLKTKWGQTSPFNDLCPKVDGKDNAVTGCVATAMAQIMAYWKYPTQGRGSNNYSWNPTDKTTFSLSANFSESVYEWDNILDYYSDFTEAQGLAVAKLMSDVGVSLNMVYGYIPGSITSVMNVETALVKYFDYNPDSVRYIQRNFFPKIQDKDSWDEVLKSELNKKRPVLMGGKILESYWTHAFVVDGYTDQDYFHLNLGWVSDYDGYYKTTAIDLSDKVEWDYVEYDAIIGICPAYSFKHEDSYYYINGDDAIMSYSLAKGSMEVPCSINNGGTYPIVAISRKAFFENDDITQVTLPSSLERIGEYAFYKCKNLKEISLPATVKTIEPFTFCDCTSLTDVTAPGVEVVKRAGFGWCTSLENFVGNSLTELDDSAFFYVTNLHIDLEKVRKIGSWAGGSEYAYLPVVEEIGDYGWICNTANIGPYLKTWTSGSMTPYYITIAPDNPYLACYDGIVYNKDMSILYYCSQKTKNGEMIGDDNRRKLIIPESVRKIERQAIQAGTNTALGISLMEKVVIPESVTDIGSGISYKEVYNYATTPQPNELGSPYAPGTLHVPQGTMAVYEAAEGWNQYETIIDDLPLADNDTFSTNDEEIVMVNGVRFEMNFYHPFTGEPVNYEFLFQSQPIIKYEHTYNNDHTVVYKTDVIISSNDIELLYDMNTLTDQTYIGGIRKISFFYDNTVIGINDTPTNYGNVRFSIDGRRIRITGLQNGEMVSLYHLDGRLVNSVKAARDGTTLMDLTGSQGLVYVLKAGNSSFKIRIK